MTFPDPAYLAARLADQLRVMRRPPIDQAVHEAWPLVVRVAVVLSLLAAAAGGALYRFAGVSPVAIVVGTAAVALGVGWTLPPARPRSRPGPNDLAALDRP